MGRFADALQVSTIDMIAQLSEQQLPDDDFDAYESAYRDSALFMMAGFDAHIVGIARGLLLQNVDTADPQLLASLQQHCGGVLAGGSPSAATRGWQQEKEGRAASDGGGSGSRSGASVSFLWIRDLVARCTVSQDVIAHAVEKGPKGSIDQENGFGYRPLHHAAQLGDAQILQAVLDAKPDLFAVTTLQQTALHIAATRGSVDVVAALIFNGVPQDAEDRKGRTAKDVACYHPWADNFASRFGTSASEMCSKVWGGSSTRPPPLGASIRQPTAESVGVGGGWLSSPHRRYARGSTQSRCDFDVRTVGDGFDADTFLFDYLMLQRPVLVRGALKGSTWDELRRRWSRETLQDLYGDEEVSRVAIPYASQFGMAANVTTLGMQLQYMAWLHAKASTDGDGDGSSSGGSKGAPPGYVFQPVGANSMLLDGIQLPQFLDPSRTEIELQTSQFYLGPAGSGAPFHFHRAAFNALVWGRKRWLVRPPAAAQYSTEHPRLGFDGDTESSRCTQESGDVLFIPDGWAHATLNDAESIGFASEFVWGSSQFEVRQ